MGKFGQATFALALLLPVGLLAQQRHQGIAGTFTSSTSILIDDAEMRPSAAASFPVVDGDEIAATSTPALFTTTDKNLITLERESKARVKRFQDGGTYIYIRKGGIWFDTKTSHLNICIANRLFIPNTGARGLLRLEKSGAVSRLMDAGAFLEQGERTCDDEAPSPLANQLPAGGVGAGAGGAGGGAGAGAGAGAAGSGAGAGAAAGAAGGTATAPAAAAGAAGAGAGGVGVAAGAVGAGSATASGLAGSLSNSCTSPGGCNHNPLSVSPSIP